MKTFLLSILKFTKSIFLQTLLGVVALISGLNCIELGNKYQVGTYEKKLGRSFNYETVGTSIDAGYDGGAIAMGIICSVCIIMIVWLEINKKSK